PAAARAVAVWSPRRPAQEAMSRSWLLPSVGVLPVLRLAGGARMRVRQAEQSGRVAAENCALVLLGQERQIVNRAGQVEVPVRVIGGEQQLGLRVDHLEREFQQIGRAHV